MINDWYDSDPEDGFNPQDHNIEMDEIAKMYAMADMKEDKHIWAKEQAEKFYSDFDNLSIEESVLAVKSLIKTKSVTLSDTNVLLDNMIQVFQDDEEYEKCDICLKIKNGINDRI
jgi:hypothetical protein